MQKYFHYLLKLTLNLPRYIKQIIVISIDVALCIFSFWVSLFLRLDKFIFLKDNLMWAVIIAIVIALPIFWTFGLYRILFRYSGKAALTSIFFAILIYGVFYFLIITVYGITNVPKSIGILQPLILFFAISGSRLIMRYLLEILNNKFIASSLSRALIYGAGIAGRQLASSLDNSYKMKVVGFIDDDLLLHGQVLQGKTIYSSQDLNKIVNSERVTHILLAIPSLSRNKRKQIVKKISEYKTIIKTLPSVTDLVEGKVTTSDIRDLDIEDILERDSVPPNIELLKKNIDSKVVLVTGAGGSIGSELCRQIIQLNPSKLLLLEINEYSLYKLKYELEEIKERMNINNQLEVISLLGSVQDEVRMKEIICIFKPKTLYHAAAYKHVPLVEENICEGVKNNVFGTLVAAKAAIEGDVLDFVLISSDKAVRPTNVMGASKRVAELCLQALFHHSTSARTKLCMVRFGNVLDSSGSVIPRFKKQISEGGPITLTHPDITRYFMTIPEAAQLVIQAGAMATGADVFLLEMGEPVKIKDLAKKIITLSGLTVKDEDNENGDIEIKIIGLRPGEKLYEELLIGENIQSTQHPKIKKEQESVVLWEQLKMDLQLLEILIKEKKIESIYNLLKKLVKGYKWNGTVVDRIFIEQKKYNYKK
jgi:FlaA1/EpsC-like NDP-sugar epimerase